MCIRDSNITILKADKGNINIIMDKQELNTKVEKFFNENNITKINKNPTLKYQKQINKFINNTKHIIQPESTKSVSYTHLDVYKRQK